MTKAELEAELYSLAKKYSESYTDDVRSFNAYVDGWHSCAALLQGEMDALNKRNKAQVELTAEFDDRIGELQDQLQSANAKLAVAINALKKIAEFYIEEGKSGDCLTCHYDNYIYEHHTDDCDYFNAYDALAQIAAMDASEGKWNE